MVRQLAEGGPVGPQVLDRCPDTELRFGEVAGEEAFGHDNPVAGLELEHGVDAACL